MADKKKVTPLEAEIDEVGLSVLGWEISNFQARLVTKDYGGGDVLYEAAASAQVRFHPDDWEVRYNASNLSESDYLSPIVWQLRSRSRGPLMSYQQLVLALKGKEVRAPKMVSASMDAWEGKGKGERKGNPDDLYVWVGGVDWEEIDGWHSEPAFKWRDVPCDVVDYTTPRGVAIDVKEHSARVRDGEYLEVTVRVIHPLGSADELLAAAIDSDDYFGDAKASPSDQADFVVQAPDVVVDVFDDTGFLLESRDLSNYRWVTVGEGGVVPKRNPSFITVPSFRLDDFAGKPARVLIRIQDPTG